MMNFNRYFMNEDEAAASANSGISAGGWAEDPVCSGIANTSRTTAPAGGKASSSATSPAVHISAAPVTALEVATSKNLPPAPKAKRRINDAKNLWTYALAALAVIIFTLAIFFAIIGIVYAVTGTLGDALESLFTGINESIFLATITMVIITLILYSLAQRYGLTRSQILRQTSGAVAAIVAVQEVALLITNIVVGHWLLPDLHFWSATNLTLLGGMMLGVALSACFWVATLHYMYFVSNSKLTTGLAIGMTVVLFALTMNNFGVAIGGLTGMSWQMVIVNPVLIVWVIFMFSRVAGDKGYAMYRATLNQ